MSHPDSRYTVLKSTMIKGEELILAKITNPSGCPFVTWWRAKNGSTYSGQYFNTEAEGNANFTKRAYGG